MDPFRSCIATIGALFWFYGCGDAAVKPILEGVFPAVIVNGASATFKGKNFGCSPATFAIVGSFDRNIDIQSDEVWAGHRESNYRRNTYRECDSEEFTDTVNGDLLAESAPLVFTEFNIIIDGIKNSNWFTVTAVNPFDSVVIGKDSGNSDRSAYLFSDPWTGLDWLFVDYERISEFGGTANRLAAASWPWAISSCENEDRFGYSDWYLPSAQELTERGKHFKNKRVSPGGGLPVQWGISSGEQQYWTSDVIYKGDIPYIKIFSLELVDSIGEIDSIVTKKLDFESDDPINYCVRGGKGSHVTLEDATALVASNP